jgi:murein endopeptidase
MKRIDRTAVPLRRVALVAPLLLLPALGAFADDPPSAASVVAPASETPAVDIPPPPPEVPPALQPDAVPVPAPSEAESLVAVAQRDVEALGPLSIGTPDAGLLVNPLPLPEGALWTIRNPSESYGTGETLDFIIGAIRSVESRYPGSPRVVIGDISNPSGGRLNRHRSHQAGRDADIGFYYARGEVRDFALARKRDLDLPRTWALVRSFVTETDVDRIFVDRSIIRLLYAYAVEAGEDRSWLAEVFGRAATKGLIQHERGHKNHLHVRFYNAVAQERARVTYPVLVETGAAPPPRVKHRARRGETIAQLAARYGSSVSAIRAANGLRTSRLRAGRAYLIPIRRVPADAGPVVIPPRRLPPPAATQSAATAPASEPDAGAAAGTERR